MDQLHVGIVVFGFLVCLLVFIAAEAYGRIHN